ncbi:hypothetical protein LY76DRAFT_351377 [Colletotrichum caudatum]|nr:hypothetical protein LY76DRAFT_351377 [Colletotrichum caudatum]
MVLSLFGACPWLLISGAAVFVVFLSFSVPFLFAHHPTAKPLKCAVPSQVIPTGREKHPSQGSPDASTTQSKHQPPPRLWSCLGGRGDEEEATSANKAERDRHFIVPPPFPSQHRRDVIQV